MIVRISGKRCHQIIPPWLFISKRGFIGYYVPLHHTHLHTQKKICKLSYSNDFSSSPEYQRQFLQLTYQILCTDSAIPDSKVHGANMGPTLCWSHKPCYQGWSVLTLELIFVIQSYTIHPDLCLYILCIHDLASICPSTHAINQLWILITIGAHNVPLHG